MRLSKIRIAGFKSFVDPVTLDLRSNLVGILGPNGCGKSNTIDAVRWVMGESSARHLRGQSMEDVIFNGSSARKPVGLASVELVFDNSDGQLGGEYARYAEIAVKRQVSRDGTSKFFLNGTRCRRRDITDIFLGTGLGPRSYAIIEQGMISRLIEAKPEELRNTLEEAAGISRYKDRRRETENRISHTRENLERLTDLREELEKQLQRLDKQARAAERFRELREEQRRLEAISLLLQWQSLQAESQALVTQLSQVSTRYQAQLATVRHLEADIEQQRQEYTTANDALNEVQGSYYQAGADISRLEQSIQHHKDTAQRQQASLNRLQQTLDETLQHAEEDREKMAESRELLAELEPRAASLQEQLEMAEERLFDAEQAALDWQEQWQQLQQQIADPTRQAQVEKTRMEQLERQSNHLQQRLTRLQQEAQQLSTSQFVQDIQTLENTLAITQEAQANAEQQLAVSSDSLHQQQQQLRELQTELDQQRSRRQSIQGRLASLETLQQAGLQKDNKRRKEWLQLAGLDSNQRLAEQLQVETGWEQALETLLELDTVMVEALEGHASSLVDAKGVALLEESPSPAMLENPSRLPLVRGGDNQAGDRFLPPLAEKILHPSSARTLVNGIYCCTSLEEALANRQHLAPSETLITPDGTRVGLHWLSQPRTQDAQSGMLQRQQDIRQLGQQLAQLEAQLEVLQAQQESLRDSTRELDANRLHWQAEANRLHREASEQASRLHALQQRIDQLGKRQQQLEAERTEISLQLEQQQEELEQATGQRNLALALLEELQDEREQLAATRDDVQTAVSTARTQVRELRDEYQDVLLEQETSRTQLENSQHQLERVNSRLQLLEEQRDELLEQMAAQDDPLEELQASLELALEQRATVELQLTDCRKQVQAIDQHIRTQDAERVQAERQAETLRDQQETLKLDWQAVQVRSQTVQEQFEQSGFVADTLAASLDENETADNIHQQLDNINQGIQRLGAINLAAIDEYREQSERKVYLDQQNDDLMTALETLETAIRKIDRETRARFKETFDQVNSRLGDMFPRLFGGGECHLEMTDDDLLTTGISIMARPPGKRISSIHLMSGGEKALTAVALVFAIFELNPAPFCMLDEVDAPLDEANVGRFCELVRHMSERVQFIFITHNKTTMELAQNLIGVTMREAGVSRLVSVDVDEAVKLANA